MTESAEQLSDAAGAEPAEAPATWRRTLTVVLVVIAILAGFVGNLSGWAWYAFFDTKEFVSIVAPLSADEDVSEVIATELVDTAFTDLDVETKIADSLPDSAGFLAGPITTTAQSFAVDGVQDLIRSDAFQAAWREGITVAHEAAVALLRGETDRVEITDGQVVLDLSGAADRIVNALDSVGFDVIDTSDLPDDFGQIVLLEDEQLGRTQDAVELLDTFSIWLPIVALAAWLGALLASSDRRRIFVVIGVAVLASNLVQLVVLRAARRSLLDDIPTSAVRGAAATVWDEVTESLRAELWALAVLGALVAAFAWFLGPGSRATRLRHGFQRRVAALRERHVPEGETDFGMRAVAPYRRLIEGVVLAGALLFLAARTEITVTTVLVVSIVALVLVGLVELVAGPSPPATDAGARSTEEAELGR